jgi:DNA-binding GntR family transcriptional regulator
MFQYGPAYIFPKLQEQMYHYTKNQLYKLILANNHQNYDHAILEHEIDSLNHNDLAFFDKSQNSPLYLCYQIHTIEYCGSKILI